MPLVIAEPNPNLFTLNNVSFVQTLNLTTDPRGIFFRNDGGKFFVADPGDTSVHEYTMSTPWDISTASSTGSFDTSTQDTGVVGVHFRPDGMKMFITATINEKVYEYNLGTAWTVTSATFAQDVSIVTNSMDPRDLFFKPDGLKMYTVTQSTQRIVEYNLSIAWDISTRSFVQTLNPPALNFPFGLYFTPDGTKMFVTDSAGDDVNEYALSTAWDISTASHVQNDAQASISTPWGVFISTNGTKMYVVDFDDNDLTEFNLT